MKYYLIAGEASGDLHASNLMKALKKIDPRAEFRYWGGSRMEEVEGQLVQHYREVSFMGFWEVARNIVALVRHLRRCKQDIKAWQPDVVIPVDFPGFNLRITKFVARLGIPVCYYISPQLWAWKSSRVRLIRRYVQRMICILPFEVEFYRKHGIEVDFVGHPLLDSLKSVDARPSQQEDRPVVALLPGSRRQEVAATLPVMISVASHFPDYQFVICGVSAIERSVYDRIMAGSDIRLVVDRTEQILSQAHAALITSGTATLQAALLDVPQVVCYKGGALSYFIGRRLVRVKYIALVNLLMDKKVVDELIQNDLTRNNIISALTKVLAGPAKQAMLGDYTQLRQKLGKAGASHRAAQIVYDVAAEHSSGRS